MINLYDTIIAVSGEDRANHIILHSLNSLFVGSRNQEISDPDPEGLKKEIISSAFIGEAMFGSNKFFNQDEWQQLLSKLFKFARENNVDLSKDKHFNRWITDNSGRLAADLAAGKYSSYWSRPTSDYVALIEAAFVASSVTPEQMFNLRYSKSSARRQRGEFDTELAHAIAARTPDFVLKIVEEADFHKNYGYSYRGLFYEVLAFNGKLSKKAARHIRSDPSMEAAEIGIRTIAKNLEKFPNSAEVLSQVMDVNHLNVAMYLAKNVPREYLPFMAVCQDQSVREAVVNRMMESDL